MATPERDPPYDYRLLLWFTAQHLAVVTEQIVRIEHLCESPERERYPVALLEQRLERLKHDRAWLVHEHAVLLQHSQEQRQSSLHGCRYPREPFGVLPRGKASSMGARRGRYGCRRTG